MNLVRALVAALVLAALAPAVADAKRVRIFTVSPRFGLDWVDTREHFAQKLGALADARGRGMPGVPGVQEGVDDVRSRLLGPADPARPAATARDLVTLPEDVGLMAAFTGQRGAAARDATDLTSAVAALAVPYGPVNAYYAQKFPSLAGRPAPPTRLLATALTDTFVRVGVESFAGLADRLDAYVVAGTTLVQDWQVVCASRAAYVAPPGAGPCAEENALKVAALRSPDEPDRTYAYEATSPRPSTLALVFDPDGKLVAKTVKAYLTPVELPGQLDLVPGEVDGVRAIPTPVGRLGIATSKDAWMPDVMRKLDEQRAEILVQPEFFVGNTVRRSGPWQPDTLQGSGPSDVLRNPSLRAMAMPQLVGNVFDFSADAQATIVTAPTPGGPVGGFVGQPAAPGFATVSRWVLPDPTGLPFAARRERLGAAGEALAPGGPPCASAAQAAPCAGGQAESVLFADATVGETPSYVRAKAPRRPKGRAGTFGIARAIAPGRNVQRNVALAARGSRAWAAWEERRGDADVVRIARSTDAGATWSRPVELGAGLWPSLSIGTDGTLWIAFERSDRALVSSSDDGGRTWAVPLALPAVGGAPQHKPAVAATGAGRAFVAWVDHRVRSPSDNLPQAGLFASTVTRAAGATEPQRLDRTGATFALAAELDHAWAPTVAARGSRLVVSWVDFRAYDWDVVARESDDAGASFGLERQVNAQPDPLEALDDQPAAVITAGSAGGPLVAFTDWSNPASSAREPSALYDTRVARLGRAPRQVDGDGGAHVSTFNPALAALPAGDAVAAWQDTRAGVGRIEVGRVGPFAVPVGVPLRVARAVEAQSRPAIAVAEGVVRRSAPAPVREAAGRVLVAWEDARDGPRQIRVARARASKVR